MTIATLVSTSATLGHGTVGLAGFNAVPTVGGPEPSRFLLIGSLAVAFGVWKRNTSQWSDAMIS